MREVMDIREASDYLRISDWKLRQMVRQRSIPHFRVGKKIMFRRSALESWIANQEKQSLSI